MVINHQMNKILNSDPYIGVYTWGVSVHVYVYQENCWCPESTHTHEYYGNVKGDLMEKQKKEDYDPNTCWLLYTYVVLFNFLTPMLSSYYHPILLMKILKAQTLIKMVRVSQLGCGICVCACVCVSCPRYLLLRHKLSQIWWTETSHFVPLTKHSSQEFQGALAVEFVCFTWHYGSVALLCGIQLAFGLVWRFQGVSPTWWVALWVTLGGLEGGHSWALLLRRLRTSLGLVSSRAVRIPTWQLRALRNHSIKGWLQSGTVSCILYSIIKAFTCSKHWNVEPISQWEGCQSPFLLHHFQSPVDLKTCEQKRAARGLPHAQRTRTDRDPRTTANTAVPGKGQRETQRSLVRGYLSPRRLLFPVSSLGPNSAPNFLLALCFAFWSLASTP